MWSSPPMAAKGFLTKQQLKKLQTALKESESPQLRERILMLLLMNDGKTYREISDFIGCSERTVVYWCVHGDPDNLESLRDGREQGNYQKATSVYSAVSISRRVEAVTRPTIKSGRADY